MQSLLHKVSVSRRQTCGSASLTSILSDHSYLAPQLPVVWCPLEFENHQTRVVRKAASHVTDGRAARIGFSVCASWSARDLVPVSQGTQPSRVHTPCARNRGGAARGRAGRARPPPPPPARPGSAQPHVLSCPSQWLLP